MTGGPLPPDMIYRLTVRALFALDRVVREHDEAVDAEVKERSQHPEYGDASEAVIKRGFETAEDIEQFQMNQGHGIPSSITGLLQEAYRDLYGCATFAAAKNPDAPCPDPYAQEGHRKLHEALKLLQEREQRLAAALPKAEG